MTDGLGVDAEGLWIRRTKRRGWTKGKPRRPRAPSENVAPQVPSPVIRPVPDVVWVVWNVVERLDAYQLKESYLETVGAYADPVEALERLVDTPGARVSRAIIQ